MGCDFVVHTASPVAMINPRNHNDLIVPAVNGVTFVLLAAQKHKVKRVVVTSSVAAVKYGDLAHEKEVYDESMWSDLNAWNCNAYVKSKTFSERAVWDFKDQMETEGKYCPELVTICPSIIFGEAICGGDNTSSGTVKKLLLNQVPGIAPIHMCCVDIKDCSLAHVRALEKIEAVNSRFILSNLNMTMTELTIALDTGLKEKGYDYRIQT